MKKSTPACLLSRPASRPSEVQNLHTPVALLEYGHPISLNERVSITSTLMGSSESPEAVRLVPAPLSEGQSLRAIRAAYGPRPGATALLHWGSDRLFYPIGCISTLPSIGSPVTASYINLVVVVVVVASARRSSSSNSRALA